MVSFLLSRSPRLRLAGEALVMGLLWFAICLHWRPLVYNYDGYMYPIEGRQLLENINAHHLLWIPVQALWDALALRMNIEPLLFCQIAGIVISAAFVMLIYLIFVQFSRDKRMSCILVLFLAFTPSYWFLTMQNLPYVTFFGFMALTVWAMAHYERGGNMRYLVGAVVSLAMAVHFQQAAVLLFIPLGLFFLTHERTLAHQRWRRLMAGLAISIIFVCLPYLVLAHLIDIDSISEFKAWVTDYLDSQHGLQYHWIGFIQAAIGMTRCLIQSVPAEEWFIRSWTSTTIGVFYSLIGTLMLIAIGGVVVSGISQQTPHKVLKGIGGFVIVWCVFIFFWEPLIAHYWCLPLILALLAMALISRHWRPALRIGMAAVLLLITAWNGYANIHQDRREHMRNPEARMAAMRQFIGPRDCIVFLARKKIQYVDYDLLFQTWSAERSDGVVILIPDLIHADVNEGEWIKRVREQLDHVRLRR